MSSSHVELTDNERRVIEELCRWFDVQIEELLPKLGLRPLQLELVLEVERVDGPYCKRATRLQDAELGGPLPRSSRKRRRTDEAA